VGRFRRLRRQQGLRVQSIVCLVPKGSLFSCSYFSLRLLPRVTTLCVANNSWGYGNNNPLNSSGCDWGIINGCCKVEVVT
jgi:hypothetical protein